MTPFPFLTVATFTPFVGAILLLLAPRMASRNARFTALGFSLATLGWIGLLTARFIPGSGNLQFQERWDWIPNLAIHYFLGIDGIGLVMVLLTGLLTPFALLAASKVEKQPALFYALVLFLETGLLGTFTALNFFHWFLFWELSLIPAFFLVKFWGGPNRSAAATQFFIYTMVGSIAMLLGFAALYLATGSFDFIQLAELGRSGEIRAAFAKANWFGLSAGQISALVFFGVLLAFAVKAPMMPFHTWLPEVYAEAPTSVTMLLTGAMSKMGAYGFLRILLPIFPEETREALGWLLGFTALTIVFSAGAALAQTDLKRMLAYSSINHVGYCMLGIFAVAATAEGSGASIDRAAAWNGAVLQIFNHGLTAPALFCLVGLIEARSGGLRGLNDFGGLRKAAPLFAGFMGIAMFASVGLPGLNGFVGEFLIFKGVFGLASWAAAVSAIALLITAAFYLTFFMRIFHGPLEERWRSWPDLSWNERALLGPPLLLMLVLGIWPQLLVGLFNRTVWEAVKFF